MSRQSTFSSLICRDITGIPREIIEPTGMEYDEVADLPVEVSYEVIGDEISVQERARLEEPVADIDGSTLFYKHRAFFLTDEEQARIAQEIHDNLMGEAHDYAYERSRE